MAKKILFIFVLVAVTALAFASCNGGSNSFCDHTYEKTVYNEPTCNEYGEKGSYGYTYSAPYDLSADFHTYAVDLSLPLVEFAYLYI